MIKVLQSCVIAIAFLTGIIVGNLMQKAPTLVYKEMLVVPAFRCKDGQLIIEHKYSKDVEVIGNLIGYYRDEDDKYGTSSIDVPHLNGIYCGRHDRVIWNGITFDISPAI